MNMTGDISLLVAFGAGILSFLSPCVLPLVPVYLATIYGQQLFTTTGFRIRLFLHSLLFVAGFAVVFSALGAIAGLTGYALSPNYGVLYKVAGVLLIALGLFMLAALKIPWLNYEKRLHTSGGGTPGYLRSFLIGAVFSLGWTACVGPILGGILTLASVQTTAWNGALLLVVYSFGIGLPFLVLGLAFDTLSPVLKKIQRYTIWIQFISALLLVAVGILILTNNLTWFYSIISKL
jgi:cytochrome c-type biogenesis protein